MKLVDRELEARLRRRVRAALRASRTLWREYRRNRRVLGTRANPLWLFAVIPIILIGVFATESLAMAALLLALYGMASAAFRAAMFAQALLVSNDVAVLAHYPVSDADVFAIVWRKTMRKSVWTLVYFATFYVVAAGRSGRPALLLAALLAAGLQWLCVLSLSLLIASYVSQPKALLLAIGFGLAGVVVFFTFPHPLRIAPGLSTVILVVTPPGWVSHAFYSGLLEGNLLSLIGLAPALILAARLPAQLRHLRERHEAVEFDIAAFGSAATQEARPELDAPDGLDRGLGPLPAPGAASRPESAADAVTTAILRRHFLEPRGWLRKGVIEWIVARWIPARDDAVVEFLLGSEPSWTKRWKLAAAAVLLAVGVSYLKPTWSETALVWTGVFATLVAVPVVGGKWPGLELARLGYLASPRHAAFPISFGQMARVLYTASLARTLAWGPIVVGLAAHYAWRQGADANLGMSMGLRIVYAFLTALPILVAVRISSGTLDMNGVDIGAAFRAWPIIAGFLGFAVAGFYFFSRYRDYTVLPPVAMLVVPFAALWLYRLAYDRGRIDLLCNARE